MKGFRIEEFGSINCSVFLLPEEISLNHKYRLPSLEAKLPHLYLQFFSVTDERSCNHLLHKTTYRYQETNFPYLQCMLCAHSSSYVWLFSIGVINQMVCFLNPLTWCLTEMHFASNRSLRIRQSSYVQFLFHQITNTFRFIFHLCLFNSAFLASHLTTTLKFWTANSSSTLLICITSTRNPIFLWRHANISTWILNLTSSCIKYMNSEIWNLFILENHRVSNTD